MTACESNPWIVEAEAAIPRGDDYYTWFSEVAGCLGMADRATRARFDRIEWRQAHTIEHPDRGKALGLWTKPHRITIRQDQVHSEFVVKHEMVHDLLQDPAHPTPFFADCAGR